MDGCQLSNRHMTVPQHPSQAHPPTAPPAQSLLLYFSSLSPCTPCFLPQPRARLPLYSHTSESRRPLLTSPGRGRQGLGHDEASPYSVAEDHCGHVCRIYWAVSFQGKAVVCCPLCPQPLAQPPVIQ